MNLAVSWENAEKIWSPDGFNRDLEVSEVQFNISLCRGGLPQPCASLCSVSHIMWQFGTLQSRDANFHHG